MAASLPFSLLELASVREGDTIGQTLANSVAYARHAQALGFKRFWLAEHHNMEGISSAATAVLIGHIANATETIRVGSGGVMLPNHPPLVIAEQFGTLEILHPGRIDLGLGRAPGTDPMTSRALRREGLGADQLDRHLLLELCIHAFGQKHRAHAPGRDAPGDAIGAEPAVNPRVVQFLAKGFQRAADGLA